MKRLLAYLWSGCFHQYEPYGELHYREAMGIYAGNVAIPRLRCRAHRCVKCGTVKEFVEGREESY